MAAGIVVALIAVGALLWAMAGDSAGSDRSGERCVTVAIASTMGGGVEHECGAAARDWCRAASLAHDTHAEAVQAQCRVAGILPRPTTPTT